MSLKSVFVTFPTPKPLLTSNTNAIGPIIGIEIMAGTDDEGEDVLVYWSDDGQGDEGGGTTSYGSLAELCENYGFDLGEILGHLVGAFMNAVDQKEAAKVADAASLKNLNATDSTNFIARSFVALKGTEL